MAFDRPPFYGRGYACDEVDAFLDLVARALSGEPTLTADDVRNVGFRTLPLFTRRGYDEDQVDAFLDLVAAELATRSAQAP